MAKGTLVDSKDQPDIGGLLVSMRPSTVKERDGVLVMDWLPFNGTDTALLGEVVQGEKRVLMRENLPQAEKERLYAEACEELKGAQAVVIMMNGRTYRPKTADLESARQEDDKFNLYQRLAEMIGRSYDGATTKAHAHPDAVRAINRRIEIEKEFCEADQHRNVDLEETYSDEEEIHYRANFLAGVESGIIMRDLCRTESIPDLLKVAERGIIECLPDVP